jgi:hypothetical protein
MAWPEKKTEKQKSETKGSAQRRAPSDAATTTRGVRTDVDEVGLMGVVQGVIDGRPDVLHQVIAVETVGNT